MQNNIRLILVNPSHPGNIGAVARAMKTMGLQQLTLVNPKSFPHVNATAMAAGADDILAQASITTTLADALLDAKIVFGTSARLRALQLPTFDPKTAAALIAKESQKNNIAILFGRENNGLTNEELALCNSHLYIPSAPNFSSLNIAAAVQIIAYEIAAAIRATQSATTTTANIADIELATTEEMLAFYQHLHQTMLAIKFLTPNNQSSLMPKLKRLFNRTQLEKNETNMLRGILTAINKTLGNNNG